MYFYLLTIPSLIFFLSFSSGPPLFVPHSLLIISIQHPRFSSFSSLILFFSRSFLLSFLSSLISLLFPLSFPLSSSVSFFCQLRLLSFPSLPSSLFSPALSKYYSFASPLLCILSCLILFSHVDGTDPFRNCWTGRTPGRPIPATSAKR